MKKTLNKLKDGALFGIGFLIILGISNAWVDLGTVTPGSPLTDSVWNTMVNKLNDAGTRASGIFTDGSGNVGIGTETPTAELEVNGTIVTDAIAYVDTASVMPNDMSYGAGGSINGSTITLDKGLYIVSYYMCVSQNSLTGGANVTTISISGTIIGNTDPYISSTTNGGGCGYFVTTVLKITSDTAQVAMQVRGNGGGSNTDNNPAANSVYAIYTKIY